MATGDYARLKRAGDPRWSNADRRDVLKEQADAGLQQAGVRAERLRLAELETAGRLADAKRSLAAARRVADRGPAPDDRPAVAVERSLRDGLSHVRQRLADCRQRVADKTAKLARLRAQLVRESDAAAAEAAASAAAAVVGRSGPGTASGLASVEKTSDALRLGNRRAARARDLIAENVALRSALNVQLEADVRQLAATVIELLSCGASAQRDTAEFEERYARAEAEYQRETDRMSAHARRLKTNIDVLDTHRKKIISEKEQIDDKVEDNEFGSFFPPQFDSIESSMSSDNSSEIADYHMISLMEWIDNGPMESQMYGKKENADNTNSYDETSDLRSDVSSSLSDNFTYPQEKVNRFKYEATAPSHAVQAVDYVRDALGFTDLSDALRYVYAVKSVGLRLRRMIDARKYALELAEEDRRMVEELASDRVHSAPESTLRLDADVERVRRALDVQRAQLHSAHAAAERYGSLFHQLWFQLENLAGKLRRCQVPVVRKYQVHAQKRAECTDERSMDAHRMLQGLCLTIDGADGDDGDGPVRTLSVRPCGPEPDPAASSDRYDDDNPADRAASATDTSGLRNTAVDACRELTATLYAKIKACMIRIGGDFDAADEKQLMARAYYTYDKQSQIQQALLRPYERLSGALPKSKVDDEAAVDKKTGDGTATGVITREQTKRLADDAVRWFQMPRDAEDTVRSRKPISFRKSRMVI